MPVKVVAVEQQVMVAVKDRTAVGIEQQVAIFIAHNGCAFQVIKLTVCKYGGGSSIERQPRKIAEIPDVSLLAFQYGAIQQTAKLNNKV